MSAAADFRRAVRVGIVVAASVVVLCGGIWILGSESRLWSKKVEYRTAFRNVQGLSTGSTVSLSGYRIGKVDDIHLPKDIREGLVDVLLSVEKKNSRYIRKDTKARIKTIGLLGDKYIELSPGSPGEPELPAGSEIEAIQPPNLDSLMAQGESVADNLVVLSASLRRIVDKIDRGQGLIGALISDTPEGQQMSSDIKEMIESLRSVSGKMDNGIGLAGTLFNDPKPADDLRAAIASLSRVAAKLDGGEGLAGRILSDPELANEVTTNLRDATRHLRDVTDRLDRGDGLIARLTGDKQLADDVTRDLRTSTATIAGIVRRIEEGEGTIGKLLVDETLYEGVNDILAGARKSRLTRWFVSRSQKGGAKERLVAPTPTATPTRTPKPKKPKKSETQVPPIGGGGAPVVSPVPGAAAPAPGRPGNGPAEPLPGADAAPGAEPTVRPRPSATGTPADRDPFRPSPPE